MRYATVGTGWITESFIGGAALTGEMTLHAVYSRDPEKGRAFGAKHGTALVFTDLEALASCKEVEAVYIASPNSMHYAQSRLFLEHGKHVLCEKPAAVTPQQLDLLLKTAKQHHVVFLEAIVSSHVPQRAFLKNALAELGPVSTARLEFSQRSSKYPAYQRGELPNIFNPAFATGCLMDLGVYCVYAALDLFGIPQRMTASAGFLDSGADAYGSCLLFYPDKQVTLCYSKIGESRCGSEILGDQGTVTIGKISSFNDVWFTDNDGVRRPVAEVSAKEENMSGEARSFCRYIHHPEESAAEYEAASRLAMEVSLMMAEIRRETGITFPEAAQNL